MTWEFYRAHCVGIDDREMLRISGELTNPPVTWEELWPLYAPKKERFARQVIVEPPFSAELGPFLKELHGTYKLAVVSSSSCSEIEPPLVAAGLRQYFDTIVGGESTPGDRHKPAPDPYLLAAERLGVTQALVVEDSAAGIAAGRAAGFEVVEIKHPDETPASVRRRLASG